ncbi:LysR family transcriptional regulator [Sphingomonas faeni]|uniref:LysR family transcriptional regulator n=1 Tax=Sphingomonas faeni TaxID=185950 RepID=UPI002783D08B|nr:LysR family transcriptional regulator [Sphingomonas faeni]MDQ0839352.1 DNA-binding transcriptional LysR family regulator [Sphingomonas faeni]
MPTVAGSVTVQEAALPKNDAMNLADLAIFVEAIKEGSLAAAGRRIGITPMAASRRLSALEAELGTRLVHRTTRSLSPTTEGEAFLPHAETMLKEEADARAAIRPADAGATGLLRVTASVPFGRKVLVPMAAQFMRRHPELRLDLQLIDGVVDIVEQGVDLAIRIGELRDNLLVARRMASNPRRLYMSPQYLGVAGLPASVVELGGHECLTMSGVTHWTFEREGRSFQQRISGRFTANSVEALHQACLDGLGIAPLSTWNTDEDVASGRLVEVELRDAVLPDRGIWAVYPSARLVPQKVRLFTDALRTHLVPKDAAA